jgi:activator of 2-hydroxyglutaryl-CoA dehydratase
LPTEYDIGSRQAKAALIGNGSIPTAITASGFDSKETANRLVSRLLKQEGITRKDVTCLVGTGYGRIAIAYEDLVTRIVTEYRAMRLGSTRSTARPGPSSTSAARTPRRSASIRRTAGLSNSS